MSPMRQKYALDLTAADREPSVCGLRMTVKRTEPTLYFFFALCWRCIPSLVRHYNFAVAEQVANPVIRRRRFPSNQERTFAATGPDLRDEGRSRLLQTQLPPTGSRNHRADGIQADHALTFKLDYSGGADQYSARYELAPCVSRQFALAVLPHKRAPLQTRFTTKIIAKLMARVVVTLCLYPPPLSQS
mgnify:CR=1 FL=1